MQRLQVVSCSLCQYGESIDDTMTIYAYCEKIKKIAHPLSYLKSNDYLTIEISTESISL